MSILALRSLYCMERGSLCGEVDIFVNGQHFDGPFDMDEHQNITFHRTLFFEAQADVCLIEDGDDNCNGCFTIDRSEAGQGVKKKEIRVGENIYILYYEVISDKHQEYQRLEKMRKKIVKKK